MTTAISPTASGAGGNQVTSSRRAKRWIERVSAGPKASANARQPAAWIASKPSPWPT